MILSGNTLSLTNDNTTVDLSSYLDNTDAQTLSLTDTDLSISNGNTIDLSSLQDGTGTDNQELNLSGNTLSISGSIKTIDLSSYINSDNQDLTSAILSGTVLTVAIDNGASVTVDLAPLLAAQEAKINDLISRIETIEQCACNGTLSVGGVTANKKQPILYQNIPNPFNGTTSIKYYIPQQYEKAAIVFSNTSGQIIDTVYLKEKGEQELFFNSASLPVGVYFYTLYVNSHKVATKKMIIE
ncbi:Haemagluttinin family protein (fragment) [Tenacibaculum amylolyticum]